MENVTHYRDILKFPTDNDLSGAAAALTRLQEMYKLNISDIANGELNGVKYRYITKVNNLIICMLNFLNNI